MRALVLALCVFVASSMVGCGGGCSSIGGINPPGGSTVFYAQTGATTVAKVDSVLGVLSTVTVPPGYDSIRFSPDNTQFVAQSQDLQTFTLFTVNGVKIRDLVTPSGLSFIENTFNSSFTAITCWSFPGANVIRIDGGAALPLSAQTEDTNGPLNRIIRDSVSQVTMSNLDGSSPVVVPTSNGVQGFLWSPDGSKVAARTNGGGIFFVNADGTGATTLATAGDPLAILWTPDSRSVIYFLSSTDPFVWGSSTGTWRIVNVTTGADQLYYGRSTVFFSSVVAPSNEPLE